ncbi:MAG: hypothetical protein Kow0013_03920 [Pararhodobacter sp.]
MSRRNELRTDLRRMLAVLTQEHAALKDADLVRLRALGPRKEALLNRLKTGGGLDPVSAPLLDRVRQMAGRNAQLYEAVIAGIGDARALLDHARNPARSRTYGRDGARYMLDNPSTTFERRA